MPEINDPCIQGDPFLTDYMLAEYERISQRAQSAPPASAQPVTPPQPTCGRCASPITGTPTRVFIARYGGSPESLNYCQSCTSYRTFQCSHCHHQWANDYRIDRYPNPRNGRHVYLCYDCTGYTRGIGQARAPFVQCVECGSWRPRNSSSIRITNNGTRCVCNRCVSSRIEDYCADPDLRPRGKSAKNIYYGVELEVEMNDELPSMQTMVRGVRRALRNIGAILKHDGSLNNGVEIVSSPCSMALHKKVWPNFLGTGLTKGLKSYQTTTCGLHVHCSREPLSELAIAKIVCFANARHNRRFMSVIAGRTSDSYARFQHKRLEDKANWEDRAVVEPTPDGGIKTVSKKFWKKSGNRYEAVNLENNATIEFRIFRGTLKKESFFKALEFCEALVRFCSPESRSVRECMRRSAFIEYVMERKNKYPHLAAFISARWHGVETEDSKKFGFKVTDNASAEDQAQEE